MNTTQLIEAVATKNSISKVRAKEIIDSTLDVIQKEVRQGNKVLLAGFGTFEQKVRKARNGVNPLTGEKLRIPQRKVPKFSPGKAFKEVVARGRKISVKAKTKAKVNKVKKVNKVVKKKAVSKKKVVRKGSPRR